MLGPLRKLAPLAGVRLRHDLEDEIANEKRVRFLNPQRDALTIRFWAKVSVAKDGCWIWTGATNNHGYGHIGTSGHDSVKIYAHRLAYEAFISGPIPPGLELDHLCRVPRCVNPEHLQPVTHRENILRGVNPSAANAAKTHCIHGHPFDEANTYLRPDGGGRQCRRCTYDRTARYRRALA